MQTLQENRSLLPSLSQDYGHVLLQKGKDTKEEIRIEIETVSAQLVGALSIGGITHLGNDASLSPSNAVVTCRIDHLVPLIETIKRKGLFSIQTKAMVALTEHIVQMRTYALEGNLDQLDTLMVEIEKTMQHNSVEAANNAVQAEVALVRNEMVSWIS